MARYMVAMLPWAFQIGTCALSPTVRLGERIGPAADHTSRLRAIRGASRQIGPALGYEGLINVALLFRNETRVLSWSNDATLRLWDVAASQAVAGWAAAWAGCKVVGAFGAGFGTGLEPGGGTAVGGFVGCIIGGAVRYYAASEVAGEVYDWADGALFTPLPETTPQ
jgi:hypothetical protein